MHLVDTNVLITAKNSYYGMDFAPGYWQWLAEEYLRVDIRSIPAVRSELMAQEDDLADWASQLPSDFWLEENDADIVALQEIATWTMTGDPRFRHAARTEFLDTADYRLVAKARAGGHVIVTHEVPQPEGRKRIKIPDVCAVYNIPSREPFELFNQLGLSLARPAT